MEEQTKKETKSENKDGIFGRLFKKKQKPPSVLGSKHKVIILYKDYVSVEEIDYPEDGVYKKNKSETYYLKPDRHVHLFIAGHVNEIEGAELYDEALIQAEKKEPPKGWKQKFKLVASYEFLNAYESKILRQLHAVEQSLMDSNFLMTAIAVIAVVFVIWKVMQLQDQLTSIEQTLAHINATVTTLKALAVK